MRRFFVEEVRDEFARIGGAEARHIKVVLRLRQGDELLLIDSGGNRYKASIYRFEGNDIVVKIGKKYPPIPPSPLKIILCQAIIRAKNMDLVIQKASELGVYEIIPFYSERTVLKLSKEREAQKVRHWKEIAIQSAKQSGRAPLLNLNKPLRFADMLKRFKYEEIFKLLLWEGEEKNLLKQVLRSSPLQNKAVVVVGPEGGFSEGEIEMAKEAGFMITAVGQRILRSETASLVISSILQYEWGDLSD